MYAIVGKKRIYGTKTGKCYKFIYMEFFLENLNLAQFNLKEMYIKIINSTRDKNKITLLRNKLVI